MRICKYGNSSSFNAFLEGLFWIIFLISGERAWHILFIMQCIQYLICLGWILLHTLRPDFCGKAFSFSRNRVTFMYEYCDAYSERISEWTLFHSHYIYRVYLQYELFGVYWNLTCLWKLSHILHIYMVSPLCEFADVLWGVVSLRRISHS